MTILYTRWRFVFQTNIILLLKNREKIRETLLRCEKYFNKNIQKSLFFNNLNFRAENYNVDFLF